MLPNDNPQPWPPPATPERDPELDYGDTEQGEDETEEDGDSE